MRHMFPGPPAPHEFPAARSPAAFVYPLLTCASGAIPFRKYAVAESTGISDNKGEQHLRQPLRDCACETPFPRRNPAKLGLSMASRLFIPNPLPAISIT